MLELAIGVGEVNISSRRVHYIVVEVLAQRLPQLKGKILELETCLEQVVGSHDCGISTRITATYPGAIEYQHIGYIVVSRQIVRTGQTMSTPPTIMMSYRSFSVTLGRIDDHLLSLSKPFRSSEKAEYFMSAGMF